MAVVRMHRYIRKARCAEDPVPHIRHYLLRPLVKHRHRTLRPRTGTHGHGHFRSGPSAVREGDELQRDTHIIRFPVAVNTVAVVPAVPEIHDIYPHIVRISILIPVSQGNSRPRFPLFPLQIYHFSAQRRKGVASPYLHHGPKRAVPCRHLEHNVLFIIHHPEKVLDIRIQCSVPTGNLYKFIYVPADKDRILPLRKLHTCRSLCLYPV